MRYLSSFALFLLIVLVFACRENNDSVNANNLTTSFQELQDHQRYQDSVRTADSIAKETERRKIEEDKSMKLSIAKTEINDFTTKLMKKVSPATGKNPSYNIIMEELTYDELTKTMSVVFESSWDAYATFNPDPGFETHIFKGKLFLYGTGEIHFESISSNEVLDRATKANKAAQDLNDILKQLSSSDNDE